MNNKYLSDFQIIGSTIKSIKIKNDFYTMNNGKNVKRKIDISHLIGDVETMEGGEILSGTVILNIKVAISENKKKYNLEMSIEGCFSAPSQMGDEIFKNMLEVNGITALYSIARGFVQSTSSQTLLTGSVLLPMINVVAYSRDLREDTGNQEKGRD